MKKSVKMYGIETTCNVSKFSLNGVIFFRAVAVNSFGKEYGTVRYSLTDDSFCGNNWDLFAALNLSCNFDTPFESVIEVLVQDENTSICANVAPTTEATNSGATIESTTKKIDRKSIFCAAWKAVKSKGISISAALAQAWFLYKNPILATIATASNEKPITFTYIKDDGSERIATTNGVMLSTIKKGFVRYNETIDGENALRSFRIERLVGCVSVG